MTTKVNWKDNRVLIFIISKVSDVNPTFGTNHCIEMLR